MTRSGQSDGVLLPRSSLPGLCFRPLSAPLLLFRSLPSQLCCVIIVWCRCKNSPSGSRRWNLLEVDGSSISINDCSMRLEAVFRDHVAGYESGGRSLRLAEALESRVTADRLSTTTVYTRATGWKALCRLAYLHTCSADTECFLRADSGDSCSESSSAMRYTVAVTVVRYDVLPSQNDSRQGSPI